MPTAITNALKGASNYLKTPEVQRAKQRMEDVVKLGVDKIPDSVTKHFSTHDMLKNVAGQDIADKLLPNSPDSIRDSAASYTARAHNQGAVSMQPIRDILDDMSGMRGIKGRIWNRRENMAVRRDLQSQAFKWIQQEHHLEVMGAPSQGKHADPKVEAVVTRIRDSGFARDTLKRMQDSGMDVSNLRASDNYLPVHHDGHAIEKFVGGDKDVRNSVADFYGGQIGRMYPNLFTSGKLTARQVGNSFLKTQKDAIQRNSNVNFQGTTKDQLKDILDDAGLDPVQIAHVLNATTPNMENAGKARNLKPRISWDMEATGVTPDGRVFRAGDFMDTNIETLLAGYNNTTSARIGLAYKGITEKSQLAEMLRPARDAKLGQPDAHAADNKFLDDIENELLGRPVAGKAHALIQGGTIAAQLLMLRNSGLYNAMEIVNTAQTFGWSAVIKNFVPSMKGMWDETRVTKQSAQTIVEMLRVELHTEGRMHSVITHLENNYNAPHTWPMEMMQMAGQTTRFINLSEPIRKSHINLITGILGDLMTQFAKGDAKAAKYFDTLGLSPQELSDVAASINAHGLETRNWDTALSNKLAVVLMNSIDETAFMARKGEAPAWLAHSDVGRLLFPFFTFTAAANNKILRKNYRLDGVTGVAMNMAHYAPLAAIAAMASNVIDGNSPTEDLLSKAINIIPTLGYGSVPVSALNRGEMGGTPTPYALINSTGKLLSATAEGDVYKAVKNIPGLAIMPPVRLISSIFKEE